jgi:CubicO group peptidase (beta-lactamase class C family)
MENTSYTAQPWWAGRQAKPAESDPRTKWSAADLLRATVSDYANFVISVMRNDHLTKEIAAERLIITRNLTSSENSIVLCESFPDPNRCHVSTGFGLGWRIVQSNDELILDHTGADPDVKTFAFFLPQHKSGAVIFTNSPDVGHQIIDRMLAVLYPNPVYAATLW